MVRKVKNKVTGYNTEDGAGVKLVRVLSRETVEEYDPILMLDSFDSYDPKDYIAGFPMHPHRGIETISYIYSGKMTHRDSIGNEDTVTNGEVQWMTAGSGILHEEMIPSSERILGVQLWLNLPKKNKMTAPAYYNIKNNSIEEIDINGGKIRLLAGRYGDKKGFMSKYLPMDYYDIHLDANKEVSIPVNNENSVMIFTLIGEIHIGEELIKEKTAVKLSEGDLVKIKAANNAVQVLFISSEKLSESISWGGPIVMNTKEELNKAFEDLNNGTFLKKEIEY